MIQISETASALLLDSLQKASVPAEMGYRLASAKEGYKLRMDRPSEEDRVLSKEGHVVLIVEPEIDTQLNGIVLDTKDNDSEKLVLEPL